MKRFLLLLVIAIFCLPSEGFTQNPERINSGESQMAKIWSGRYNSRNSSKYKYRYEGNYHNKTKFVKFAIESKTDEATGITTIHWDDGSSYRGQASFGEIKGIGTMVYPDKSKYVGSWEHDQPNGSGTFQTPEGITFTVNFENGLPHGKGVIQDLDGRLYSARWVRGKLRKKSIKPIEEE